MCLQLLPKGGEGWTVRVYYRLFYARDAATARSAGIDRCTDGTTSVMVVDEQRWRRPSTSAVRRTLSARYGGADALRHRNARKQRRNWIRSGTRIQWRSRRSGVLRSERLAENTSLAAALRMDCSLSNRWLETPASTEMSQRLGLSHPGFEGHSRSAELTRMDYEFLLMLHSNYGPILHSFHNAARYLPKTNIFSEPMFT